MTAALPLGEEHHQPLDRRGKGPRVGPAGLREQRDQVWMRRQEIELGAEGDTDPFQGSVAPRREVGQRLLQLCCTAGEHGAEQAAFGVEVVKQQLLVHTGAPGDLIHARAVEPAMRELLSGRRDDP